MMTRIIQTSLERNRTNKIDPTVQVKFAVGQTPILDWDSEDRSLLGCILIHACDLSNQVGRSVSLATTIPLVTAFPMVYKLGVFMCGRIQSAN